MTPLTSPWLKTKGFYALFINEASVTAMRMILSSALLILPSAGLPVITLLSTILTPLSLYSDQLTVLCTHVQR